MAGQFDRVTAVFTREPERKDRPRLLEPIKYSEKLRQEEGGAFICDVLGAVGVETVFIGSRAEKEIGSEKDPDNLAKLELHHQRAVAKNPNVREIADMDLHLPIHVGTPNVESDVVPLFGAREIGMWSKTGFTPTTTDLSIINGQLWMSENFYNQYEDPAVVVLEYIERAMGRLYNPGIVSASIRDRKVTNGDLQIIIGENVFADGGGRSIFKMPKVVAEIHPLIVRDYEGETVESVLDTIGHVPTTAAGRLVPDGNELWLTPIYPVAWDGIDRYVQPAEWNNYLDVGFETTAARFGMKAVIDYLLSPETSRGDWHPYAELLKNRFGLNRFPGFPYRAEVPLLGGEPLIKRDLDLLAKMIDCWAIEPELATRIFLEGGVLEGAFGITNTDELGAQLELILLKQIDLINRPDFFNGLTSDDWQDGMKTETIAWFEAVGVHNKPSVDRCWGMIETIREMGL